MKTKIIAIILCLVMLVGALASCGKSRCEMCYQEKKCSTRTINGVKGNICKECWEEYNKALDDIADGLAGLADEID